MTKETKAEGGQEGQNGGIAIGTGHAKSIAEHIDNAVIEQTLNDKVMITP